MSKVEQRGWQTLLSLCRHADTDKRLDELLHFFLTPEERSALSLRVELVRELLKQEKPQREISKDLSVSIAKITRGSNELKSVSTTFKKFLKRELL